MKTIMLTETFQQAVQHARELGLDRRDVIFLGAHGFGYGFNANDVRVVYCPTFERRPDAQYITERLAMIGVTRDTWKVVD